MRLVPDLCASTPGSFLPLHGQELYAGTTKKMKINRKVKGRPQEEILEIAVRPGWKKGTKITFQEKGESGVRRGRCGWAGASCMQLRYAGGPAVRIHTGSCSVAANDIRHPCLCVPMHGCAGPQATRIKASFPRTLSSSLMRSRTHGSGGASIPKCVVPVYVGCIRALSWCLARQPHTDTHPTDTHAVPLLPPCRREGNDLYFTAVVSLADALCGTTLQVGAAVCVCVGGKGGWHTAARAAGPASGRSCVRLRSGASRFEELHYMPLLGVHTLCCCLTPRAPATPMTHDRFRTWTAPR